MLLCENIHLLKAIEHFSAFSYIHASGNGQDVLCVGHEICLTS